MKKIIAVVILVIVILGVMLAVAKFTSDDREETTVPSVTETFEESAVSAMVTVTESETATEAQSTVKPTETTAVQTTKTSTTAPTTTQKATATTTTTTTATTTTTTTQPSETSTTQQSNGSPELLNKYVLAPINSGSYTMTISAFGNDRSPDDKLVKTVNGGKTAFWFSIPAANMAFKVFPSDGKYYLASSSKYCELTKEQYDSCCATFNRGMYNFAGLTYQKTETVRENLTAYTCEHFKTSEGLDCVLWFKGAQLNKFELKIDGVSNSLPMTVSPSVNTNYFILEQGLEEVDYEMLKSYIELAGLFF